MEICGSAISQPRSSDDVIYSRYMTSWTDLPHTQVDGRPTCYWVKVKVSGHLSSKLSAADPMMPNCGKRRAELGRLPASEL